MKIFGRSTVPLLLAAVAVPAWGGLSAQVQDPNAITVTGQLPTDLTGLPEGPEVQGIISARKGGLMQVTTADVPARCWSAISSAIACSQGRRSSSSSGVPADILSMLACGCRSSPSEKSRPSSLASRSATDVLPVAVTPIATMCMGGRNRG